jgi:hypothetical protein
MIKTKLLLNYPTKFQSIRKSFSIFDIYDKINDILKRKHILSKKLKNMYGGGDTKQVYDLQQILQSIEEMNGELGTLEANLIVGFKNFPSFDTNVNTMNEFLKGVIDNIKNEQENHKDKYESINSIINDQFNTKVTIDGVEYETKNNILEEASKALSQQIKNKNFKDAYGIIKSVYEEYKKIYNNYYTHVSRELYRKEVFKGLPEESIEKINVYIQSLQLNDLFILEYKFLQSFSVYLGIFLRKFLGSYSTEKLTMTEIINQLTLKIISIRDAFKVLDVNDSTIVKKIRNTINDLTKSELKVDAELYKNLCYKKDVNGKDIEIVEDRTDPDNLRNKINGDFVSNGVLNSEKFNHFTNLYEDLTGAVRVYIRIRNVTDLQDDKYYVSRFILNGNPNYVSIRHRESKTCSIGNSNCCYSAEDIIRKIDKFLQERKVYCEGMDSENVTSKHKIACPSNKKIYIGQFFSVFDKDDNTDNMFKGINLDIPDIPDKEGKIRKSMIIGVKNTIDQVKNGYSIVLFGYGFSGSGKTYTLLGSKNKDTGKFEGTGLIDLALKDLAVDDLGKNGLDKLECAIVEVYGERTALASSNHSVNQYLYIYNNENSKTLELEDTMISTPKIIKTDDIKRNIVFSNIDGEDIDEKITKIKTWINKIDIERRLSQRVKDTSNNPESSRGHLFIMMKLHFGSNVGYLTFVDMAGSEDVVQIVMSEFKKFNVAGKVGMGGREHSLSSYASMYGNYYPERLDASGNPIFDIKRFCKEALYPKSGPRVDDTSIKNNKDYIDERLTANNITRLVNGAGDGNCKTSVPSGQFNKFLTYIAYDLNKTLKQGYFINDSLNNLQRFMLIKSGRETEVSKLGHEYAHASQTYTIDTKKLIFTKYIKKDDPDSKYNVKTTAQNIHSSLMVKMLKYLDTLSGDSSKITKFIMIGAIDPSPRKCQGTFDTLEFMQNIKST